MVLQSDSDYASGNSTLSWQTTSWSQHRQDNRPSAPHRLRANSELLDPKSSSYLDLVKRRCTLDDVMQEFRMNGSDSPYNPDEDKLWGRQPAELSGMGPASAYLRQKSWPEPERTPAPRLPRPQRPQRPHSMYEPRWNTAATFHTSTPIFDETPPAPFTPETVQTPQSLDAITPEQTRVLSSLPDRVVYALLRELESERRKKLPMECRFCKNNGERESYFRSHVLKDTSGRVCCPVLRAFVCKRCGASGDGAHTIKYCPFSTNEERTKSAGVLRSVRMASGRRRHCVALPADADAGAGGARGEYVVFGEPSPSAVYDNDVFSSHFGEAPLDPLWAALEQKLLL